MADEEDGGEPADVAAAGELIERLNAAIDAVNDLEDEHGALIARLDAEHTIRTVHARALKAEIADAHGPALGDTIEAQRAVVEASERLVAAERHHRERKAEHEHVQAGLSSTQPMEARMAAQARLVAARSASAAALKAMNAARKAATGAATREEKVRRALESVWARSGAPAAQLGEFLGIFAALADARTEIEAGAAVGAEAVRALDGRKALAAAEVADAMESLERLSDEIHQRRCAEDGSADDGESGAEEEEEEGEGSGSDFVYSEGAEEGEEEGEGGRSASRRRRSPQPSATPAPGARPTGGRARSTGRRTPSVHFLGDLGDLSADVPTLSAERLRGEAIVTVNRLLRRAGSAPRALRRVATLFQRSASSPSLAADGYVYHSDAEPPDWCEWEAGYREGDAPLCCADAQDPMSAVETQQI